MSQSREYFRLMQWRRARKQGERFGNGLPDGKLDGKTLKAVRERQGLTLEAAEEFVGLEPHVLAGVEKGYRSLSGAQLEAVGDRLEKLGRTSRLPGAARPPMPNPGQTHYEGDDCPGGHLAEAK